ncbi:MAG: hypothetical protein ACPG7F_17505, partial [Aggregatilineales bacterium]
MASRKKKQGGAPTFLLLLLVLAGFGGILWMNSTEVAPASPVIPTSIAPTVDTEKSLTDLLTGNFAQNTTALPTPVMPSGSPVPVQDNVPAAPAPGTSVNAASIAGTPVIAAAMI